MQQAAEEAEHWTPEHDICPCLGTPPCERHLLESISLQAPPTQQAVPVPPSPVVPSAVWPSVVPSVVPPSPVEESGIAVSPLVESGAELSGSVVVVSDPDVSEPVTSPPSASPMASAVWLFLLFLFDVPGSLLHAAKTRPHATIHPTNTLNDRRPCIITSTKRIQSNRQRPSVRAKRRCQHMTFREQSDVDEINAVGAGLQRRPSPRSVRGILDGETHVAAIVVTKRQYLD